MESIKHVKSWSDARDLLREWREESVRESRKVISIWDNILKDKIHKLGDECYVVLEQVFIAALDCYRLDVANSCLEDLSSQFPGSMRVLFLQALELEALQRYDDALEVMDNIIKRDETYPAPRKRRVAILRAKGKIPEAIKELNDYLKRFMTDMEAWSELSDLYLMEQEYAKAAFCMEELMLKFPPNHLVNQRLAEIRYTQGGYENMELAKAYFVQAAKLNPNNIRALYGILLTSVNIVASQKSTSSKKKEASLLSAWATKALNDRYREVNGPKSDEGNLETLFSSLQITSS